MYLLESRPETPRETGEHIVPEFEQLETLETLQTKLAEEQVRSDACAKNAKDVRGEGGIRHGTLGILTEMRIARFERMIKAEKKRLKQEAKQEAIDAAPKWLLPAPSMVTADDGDNG